MPFVLRDAVASRGIGPPVVPLQGPGDLLGRCPLTGPAVAPRFCLLSSPISRSVHDAFLARFGVPLRQTYSCTEAGVVTVDAAPSPLVRPETVGCPVNGVEIFAGDDPGRIGPSGETGRIWVRSPALMAGYGFPPAVESLETVDGWWPTQDVGVLEADGHLLLAGRLDDCIRTRENRLVSLAAVATRLRDIEGVTEVVVVPLTGSAGASVGAVIQASPGLSAKTVRVRLAETLPPWCWPRAVEIVPSLPRLPSGRPDRGACVNLLGGTPPT